VQADLFPEIADDLSPRARWIARHRIELWESPGEDEPWCACREDDYQNAAFDRWFTGTTADEALLKMAAKHGWTHWNLETPATIAADILQDRD